jgi:hypothetical protein
MSVDESKHGSRDESNVANVHVVSFRLKSFDGSTVELHLSESEANTHLSDLIRRVFHNFLLHHLEHGCVLQVSPCFSEHLCHDRVHLSHDSDNSLLKSNVSLKVVGLAEVSEPLNVLVFLGSGELISDYFQRGAEDLWLRSFNDLTSDVLLGKRKTT